MAPGVAPDLEAFLLNLSRRGIAVWVADGQIAVRPLDRFTSDDREIIRSHRVALVARVSRQAVEPWNLAIALRLMDATDAAIERYGVSGSHPELQKSIESVSAAYAAKDLAGVRAGCDTIKDVVLRLSARFVPTSPGRSV